MCTAEPHTISGVPRAAVFVYFALFLAPLIRFFFSHSGRARAWVCKPRARERRLPAARPYAIVREIAVLSGGGKPRV